LGGRLHRFAEFLYIRPATKLLKENKREFGYATLSLILIIFVASGNFQLLLITLDDLLGLNFMWTQNMSFPGSDILFYLLGFVGLWAVFVRLSKLSSTTTAAIRAALALLGFIVIRYMSAGILLAGPIFLLNNLFAYPAMTIASIALYIMLAISLRREKFDLSAAKYGFWALVTWWLITGVLLIPAVAAIMSIAFIDGLTGVDTTLFWLAIMIYQAIIIIGQHILFAAVAIAAQDKAICDEQQELGA